MFRILFVCTGNQCRSPVAAASFERATEGMDVEAASAGTLRTRSASPPPETIRAARELGLDVSGHHSRALEDIERDWPDLIVGFELIHLATAHEAGFMDIPTHLLPTLARSSLVTAGDPSSSAGDRARKRLLLIDPIASVRSAAKDTVPDPMGGDLKVHRRTATAIDELCTAAARNLLG